MSDMSRRGFLGHSTKTMVYLGGAGVLAQRAKADTANDKVIIAMIGIGGRGRDHARNMAAMEDVEIAYVCDVDEKGRLGSFPEQIEKIQGRRPKAVVDMRTVFEDKDVDGVFVSTTDHWHALATIWACQAGKDVYVEKPPSHSLWEGRKMIEAARKYERVVQVGLQNRSAEYMYQAREFIQNGGLGDIPLVRVHNLKMGSPFKMGPDEPVPEGVHYDLYLGPAPERPFNRGHFHGGWLKFWEYCGGDMADDSIHQLDIARFLLGDPPAPDAVSANGGTYAFHDDRTVPDTQSAIIEYGDTLMTFDLTEYANYMMKTPTPIRDGDDFPFWPQNATRIELYGTKNLMYFGRQGGGWQVMAAEGKVVEECAGRHTGHEHRRNFIDCIRSRKRPNSDIEEGHRSNVLAHLGNAATRAGGRRVVFDAASESIVDDPEANAFLKRAYREAYAVPEKV